MLIICSVSKIAAFASPVPVICRDIPILAYFMDFRFAGYGYACLDGTPLFYFISEQLFLILQYHFEYGLCLQY